MNLPVNSLILALIFSVITRTLAISSDDRLLHPVLTQYSILSNPDEQSSEYWSDQAQDRILGKLSSSRLNQNKAKNVILFLGDGMSISTLAATRNYISGEEYELSFDKFPYSGLSKTYAIDRQVPDSASTATAYLCGIKGNYGTIGVNGQIKRSNCEAQKNVSNHVNSIAEHFLRNGRKAGLVTTARVTHASPAGVYAHTADRDWESDSDILNANKDPQVCTDIASQLIFGKTGVGLDVILGGGRSKFLSLAATDDEGHKGERRDGLNLIEDWLKLKAKNGLNAEYVWNASQLSKVVGADKTDSVLGLFASDHMAYNIERNPDQQPSLTEMTEAAIKILSKNQNGYFLFVEGARIDMAHHGNEARKALNDTAEFSAAIQRAVELTNEKDTLIVVTSDHSHTLTLNGYAERGNDILGIAGRDSDGRAYSALTYANGPGYHKSDAEGKRHDMLLDDIKNPNYNFPALAPLGSETHGGEDVGIFARGPWAHLFSGVNEENVIPHLMAFASCVGDGLTMCRSNGEK